MLFVGKEAALLSSRAFRAKKVSSRHISAGLEAPSHRISHPTGRVKCPPGAETTTVHGEPCAGHPEEPGGDLLPLQLQHGMDRGGESRQTAEKCINFKLC